MKRPAKRLFNTPPHQSNWWGGRQAFLLVEATLTAVVIAGGLVLITRGIGGSLRAVSTLQQYDRLLSVAEALWNTLETEARQGEAMSPRDGTVEEAGTRYHWRLEIQPAEFPSEEALAEDFRTVALLVNREGARSPVVRLTTLWPQDWVAQ